MKLFIRSVCEGASAIFFSLLVVTGCSKTPAESRDRSADIPSAALQTTVANPTTTVEAVVPKPLVPKKPVLPAYPDHPIISGPIHRGLSIASNRNLKGRVLAISPDKLSAVTTAFQQENTVYVEAVFDGGKWDGEVIHSDHRVKGATFDKSGQRIMFAVDHSTYSRSSLYLYDLAAKRGTFVPLDTDKIANHSWMSWSADNLIDVGGELGTFVINLDTLTVSVASPIDIARVSAGPKPPPLIFEKGFVGLAGYLTRRFFIDNEYFSLITIWPDAVAVSDNVHAKIYYLKIEEPYWPWGGSARSSTATSADELAAFQKLIAESGYAGEGKWSRLALEGEVFRAKINPLNGRIVGANTDAKVANVRFTKNEEGRVGFIIGESLQEVREGDVISRIRNPDSWSSWKASDGLYFRVDAVER